MAQLFNIINNLKNFHDISENEISKVKKVYDFVYDAYTKTDGIQSDKFTVTHMQNVAYWISYWKFDYKITIIGLLHELIPLQQTSENELNDIAKMLKMDTPTQKNRVIKIENILYTLKNKLSELMVDDDKNKLQYCELVYSKYINDYSLLCNQLLESYNNNTELSNFPYAENPEAFYIILAEHLDRLENVNSNNQGEQKKLAKYTKEYLIPKIVEIKAGKIVNDLEEKCFKIEHNELYNEMNRILNEENFVGDDQINFLIKCRNIFNPNTQCIDHSLDNYKKCIKMFYHNKRSIISLYRYISKNNLESEAFFNKLKDYKKVAYHDFTLVIKDNFDKNKHSIFLDYYEKELKMLGAYILSYNVTSDKSAYYYLIKDNLENVYRFFIRNETEYLYYVYGTIVNGEVGSKKYNLINLDYKKPNKINVFKRDGKPLEMDEGSTVLDFAFQLHQEIGLHCSCAYINNNPITIPLSQKLKNGDYIEIKTNPFVVPNLNWFKYVKTDYAINVLVTYFKNQQKVMLQDHVTITTIDGSPQIVPKNTTVLDLAFQIHEELGLKFNYAIVKQQNSSFEKKVEFDYILSNGDSIKIVNSSSYTAKIGWIPHLTNPKAKRILKKFLSLQFDEKCD